MTSRARRAPAKATTKKRKHSEDSPPQDSLDFLLTSPKSALTTVDLAKIVNPSTWAAIPAPQRQILCGMLPPSILKRSPNVELDVRHPARRHASFEQASSSPSGALDELELDDAFFKDPFFDADKKTFQDHLFSGWFTQSHIDIEKEFQQNVIATDSQHVPWKDDVWLQEHSLKKPPKHDLPFLVKRGLIKPDDILAFRRSFPGLSLVVEKDALVESVRPFKVLLPPGTQTYHDQDAEKMLRVEVKDVPDLVSAVLDIDARARTEGDFLSDDDAWKAFSIWRWRDPESEVQVSVPEHHEIPSAMREGRQCHGTLFYTRVCAAYREL